MIEVVRFDDLKPNYLMDELPDATLATWTDYQAQHESDVSTKHKLALTIPFGLASYRYKIEAKNPQSLAAEGQQRLERIPNTKLGIRKRLKQLLANVRNRPLPPRN